jgi:ribosomal protein S12 methylthiotransferase
MKNGLATLAAELEKIPELKWIRLMYLSPAGINEKLIETVAKSEKIVHYFDIPIQHINDKILKDMYRPDSKEHIRRLIEKLRSAISDCLLRTTVIVGFPGETWQQFSELLDFIRWAEFDALGCFKYYAEARTAAAGIPEQVPEHIKDKRLEELMLAQQEIAFAKNKKRIGNELSCIVDIVDNKGTGEGRFYGQAPDIDSICIIKDCSAKPGQFIDTKVIDTKDYDLVVKQI